MAIRLALDSGIMPVRSTHNTTHQRSTMRLSVGIVLRTCGLTSEKGMLFCPQECKIGCSFFKNVDSRTEPPVQLRCGDGTGPIENLKVRHFSQCTLIRNTCCSSISAPPACWVCTQVEPAVQKPTHGSKAVCVVLKCTLICCLLCCGQRVFRAAL